MADLRVLKIGSGWLGAIPLGLAALTLILVFLNVWLVLSNQARQADVNQRQQFINQSIQLGRLNEGLVRALAVAAVNNKDAKLQQLLTEQGINFTVTPNAGAATGTTQQTASPPAPTDAPAPKR